MLCLKLGYNFVGCYGYEQYYNLFIRRRQYGPCNLASGDVPAGHRRDVCVFAVFESVRENLKVEVTQMIYLTAVIAIFLFIYLVVALVRPEWF